MLPRAFLTRPVLPHRMMRPTCPHHTSCCATSCCPSYRRAPRSAGSCSRARGTRHSHSARSTASRSPRAPLSHTSSHTGHLGELPRHPGSLLVVRSPLGTHVLHPAGGQANGGGTGGRGLGRSWRAGATSESKACGTSRGCHAVQPGGGGHRSDHPVRQPCGAAVPYILKASARAATAGVQHAPTAVVPFYDILLATRRHCFCSAVHRSARPRFHCPGKVACS